MDVVVARETSGLRVSRVLLGLARGVVELLDVVLGLLLGAGRAEGRLLDGGDGPLAPQGLIAQGRGQGTAKIGRASCRERV